MSLMNENNSNEKPRLDLQAIREKLAGQSGKRYWRSLEEVAELPEFNQWMEDEFPNRSTIMQINRRDLLKFMGASMALAGMSGCRSVFLPEDKVVPYVKQPEELVPGKALFYASSMPLAGYATGVLVEQHEGRPTFIAGNPDHPTSLGASDILTTRTARTTCSIRATSARSRPSISPSNKSCRRRRPRKEAACASSRARSPHPP